VQSRLGLAASALIHSVTIALLAYLFGHRPVAPDVSGKPSFTSTALVWLYEPGPGGGGGGGGNRMKDSPQRVLLPGHDVTTVPVKKAPSIEPAPAAAPEPNPIERLVIPAEPLSSATEQLPGAPVAIDAPPGPPTIARGSGQGPGTGTGNGSGDGPGDGPGLGPGRDGGSGDGPYRPGTGVTMPVELRRGTAEYTTDAMRARIQGSVLVECVVQTSGACTNVHILRSLDSTFGLDQEAVKAAGRWRFRPGMRQGRPVPVLVTMEVAFTLR
jgi:protein TonB